MSDNVMLDDEALEGRLRALGDAMPPAPPVAAVRARAADRRRTPPWFVLVAVPVVAALLATLLLTRRTVDTSSRVIDAGSNGAVHDNGTSTSVARQPTDQIVAADPGTTSTSVTVVTTSIEATTIAPAVPTLPRPSVPGGVEPQTTTSTAAAPTSTAVATTVPMYSLTDNFGDYADGLLSASTLHWSWWEDTPDSWQFGSALGTRGLMLANPGAPGAIKSNLARVDATISVTARRSSTTDEVAAESRHDTSSGNAAMRCAVRGNALLLISAEGGGESILAQTPVSVSGTFTITLVTNGDHFDCSLGAKTISGTSAIHPSGMFAISASGNALLLSVTETWV